MSGESARTVRVELGDRSYEAHVGEGLLGRLPELLERAGVARSGRCFMVFDRNVGAHGAAARGALAASGIRVDAVEIEASERGKSVGTVQTILSAMAGARLERGHVVVAIGGGITGDIAGFAAAIYRRGVPVVQCPTTLLSMVDASVGGKTGVNLEAGGTLQKNMVGAFHQPLMVVADLGTLGTLPEREFRAGLAECVKHGMLSGLIGDEGHLAWIGAALASVLGRDFGALAELVTRSVAFKAAVVSGDERELGSDVPGRPSRAVLNLGHTFAHAIETLPGLGFAGGTDPITLLHGEAVSVGLIAAAATGVELGLCATELLKNTSDLLRECGLPTGLRGLPETDRLLGLMGMDKKVEGARLRLVIPVAGCRAVLVTDPPVGAVRAGWERVRAG